MCPITALFSGRKRGKNGSSRIVYVRNYVWLWHRSDSRNKAYIV